MMMRLDDDKCCIWAWTLNIEYIYSFHHVRARVLVNWSFYGIVQRSFASLKAIYSPEPPKPELHVPGERKSPTANTSIDTKPTHYRDYRRCNANNLQGP